MITNPAQYIKYEVLDRAQAIATRNVKNTNVLFGGVVFVKNSREDIQTWRDLKNKKIVAVDQTSFGGWLIVAYEFKRLGIDPKRDFAQVSMVQKHPDVVTGILKGQGDVGIVRSGTIEDMISAGKIKREDIRVLKLREEDGKEDFPYLHSTVLYPEWPFVRLNHVPDAVAKKVVRALFTVSAESSAAVDGGYIGWTVSSNYTRVHDCLKELNVTPYENFGKLTWGALWRGYHLWIMSILFLLGGLGIMIGFIIRSRRHILKMSMNYQTILNTAGEGVLGLDKDGRHVFVNKKAASLLGFEPGDLIGRGSHAIWHHTKP